MASKNLPEDKPPRKSYSRSEAKAIAASKVYTAGGEPIHNVGAYVAAGGRPTTASGKEVYNPTAYQNAIEASVRQNTNDPKYLYHYTDDNAAASIAESGNIRASEHGRFGSGTYLTAKPPRCKSENLLSNNYGHNASRDASYVGNYVRLDADNLNAKRVEDASSRDVYKVNGSVDVGQHNGYVAERLSNDCLDQGKGYFYHQGSGAGEAMNSDTDGHDHQGMEDHQGTEDPNDCDFMEYQGNGGYDDYAGNGDYDDYGDQGYDDYGNY